MLFYSRTVIDSFRLLLKHDVLPESNDSASSFYTLVFECWNTKSGRVGTKRKYVLALLDLNTWMSQKSGVRFRPGFEP